MAEAARHAVRLSGTEMVLYDEDFHERLDTEWTLDEIHDGASRLTCLDSGHGHRRTRSSRSASGILTI